MHHAPWVKEHLLQPLRLLRLLLQVSFSLPRRMNQQKSPKKDDKDFLRKGARLSGMALQMGLTIYLGNLLGKWIDSKYTPDFAETLFTLLAIALAMYAMIRQVTQLNK